MNKIINKISLSGIISAFILMGITLLILKQTEWHFAYTLDDPYIHLKLAQNILSGHYGINLSEYSAPSSSILWPFLLAPFAFLGSVFEYMPLIINVVCALLSVIILDQFFIQLPTLKRTFLSILIMLTCNVYGIVFTGMEHSLQVLCVVFITYCLCYPEVLQQKKIQLIFFLSLFLLPLVRYEGFALSIPILFYTYIHGYKKQALICFIAVMCVVSGFSLFLYTHDLGYLPSSVMAKTAFFHGTTNYPSVLRVLYNVARNLKYFYHIYIIAFGLFLYFLKRNKYLGGVILTSSVLHLLFGQCDWFGRYEVYQLIFIVMIVLYVLLKIPNQRILLFSVILILCIFNLSFYILNTPLASSNTYHQQEQMARITQMLDDKVALNDIGSVSFRSKHEILDIFGLSSIQALKFRLASRGNNTDMLLNNIGLMYSRSKHGIFDIWTFIEELKVKLEKAINNDWINTLLKEKNIKFIMIYDVYFPNRPNDWIKIATLYLNQQRITTASSYVSFYATDDASVDKMLRVLQEYAKQYPSEYHEIRFEENMIND